MIKKCRKCREEKELKRFDPDRLGKHGVGSTCKSCKRKKKVAKISTFDPTERRGYFVIPEEKAKAFVRDKKCIIKECSIRTYEKLDFHHVYWHQQERIYTDDRNNADKGVILCRKHHSDVDTCQEVDIYCHDYLYSIYKGKNIKNT